MSTQSATSASPIRSSADLWTTLQNEGGLQPDTYDKLLVDSVISDLKLDTSRPIASQLDTVSTTRFVLALFAALQPWDRMMADVLNLFARQGVQASNGEVLIEFEFDSEHSLAFDAEQFKRARMARQRLGASIQDIHTSDTALFKLGRMMAARLASSHGLDYDMDSHFRQSIARVGGVEQHEGHPPDSPDARHWLGFLPHSEERVHERWPFEEAPPFPAWDPDDPLQPIVQPIESAIAILSARVSSYSSWRELVDVRRREESDPTVNTNHRLSLTAWSLTRVLAAQHDRMTPFLLHRLWQLHDLAPKELAARAALASVLAGDIAQFMNPVIGPSPQQALEELLALPLWQYRHQLYSIWLVTVVDGALPGQARMTLQPVDGRLRFSFCETLVAKIETDGPSFSLMAECKTAAPDDVTLLGKSRVSSVQPDYVIKNDRSGEVVYVLEAKQYRNGKKGEFARAVHDYAAVHVRAFVALANYGTMPAGMSQAIKTAAEKASTDDVGALLDRCVALGDVKPEGAGLVALKVHLATIFPAAIAVVLDGTSSMLNVLPSEDSPPLWTLLNGWHGPLMLTFSGTDDPVLIPPDRDRDLCSVLRAHAREAPLGVEKAALGFDGPRILITDSAGWQESRIMHAFFSAVIVLRDDRGRFDLTVSTGSPGDVVDRLVRALRDTAPSH
ncbi:hypothetical protein [Roseateles sp.]|uniref:hypothetical protein n=1 Tax=Roseateles sp. TaxID=1971397 RepID=UPI002F41D40C